MGQHIGRQATQQLYDDLARVGYGKCLTVGPGHADPPEDDGPFWHESYVFLDAGGVVKDIWLVGTKLPCKAGVCHLPRG